MPDNFSEVKPEGFPAYVRRLERAAARLNAPVGAGDDAQAAATVSASAERLGNNTKSRATFREETCEKTAQIQGFTLDQARRQWVPVQDQKVAVSAARQNRFSAQSSAGKLLHAEVTPRGKQWRVSGCSRRKVSAEVAVLYSPEMGKAHYGGVMICGSVWTCPPCAAKISERRKNEIRQATDAFKGGGGALYMLTFTFSHQRNDDLVQLVKRLGKARQYMRSHRLYKQLKESMGYVGDIRTLEVTYGSANGYHPHEHDLWLVSAPLVRAKFRLLQSGLFDVWSKACKAAGLGAPSRQRGVNVILAESASDYMAKFGREPKWGIASELAKQHTKTGKAKSMTPFDLLRSYQDGCKEHGARFVEFAKAFFGKRQIIWSDGLKRLSGIQELTDEEIAVQEAADAQVLCRISAFEWSVILKQPYEVRGLVLDLAERGGYEAVRRYLANLTFSEVPF